MAGSGKILSQAEIDDLIAKVQSGEISPEEMQKMMAAAGK